MSWEAWGDPPEYPCDMCGLNTDDCICHECPVCGMHGDPECYKTHGLEETEEQIDSRIAHDPLNGPWFDWPE